MKTNGFQPLTIFAKSSMLDAWQASEHASVVLQKILS